MFRQRMAQDPYTSTYLETSSPVKLYIISFHMQTTVATEWPLKLQERMPIVKYSTFNFYFAKTGIVHELNLRVRFVKTGHMETS